MQVGRFTNTADIPRGVPNFGDPRDERVRASRVVAPKARCIPHETFFMNDPDDKKLLRRKLHNWYYKYFNGPFRVQFIDVMEDEFTMQPETSYMKVYRRLRDLGWMTITAELLPHSVRFRGCGQALILC